MTRTRQGHFYFFHITFFLGSYYFHTTTRPIKRYFKKVLQEGFEKRYIKKEFNAPQTLNFSF